jgi:hypothetical protein
MDTDLFFTKYYRNVKRVKANNQGSTAIDLVEVVHLIIIAACIIGYAVFLCLNDVFTSVKLAGLALFSVGYLTVRASSKNAYEKSVARRKSYNHNKYLAINSLLTEFVVEEDKSIDLLIERLEENKEKYNYGKVFLLSLKTAFGIVGAILSFFSFSELLVKLVEESLKEPEKSKIAGILEKNFDLNSLYSGLKDIGPLLVVDVVLTFILIIELIYVWNKIVIPFIKKKYYYHDEIVADLKEYKLFREYHASKLVINISQSTNDRKDNKKPISKFIARLNSVKKFCFETPITQLFKEAKSCKSVKAKKHKRI